MFFPDALVTKDVLPAPVHPTTTKRILLSEPDMMKKGETEQPVSEAWEVPRFRNEEDKRGGEVAVGCRSKLRAVTG